MLLFANSLSPAVLAGILIAALVGMTVHEFAHNYVGYLMGDPVPAREGRLTLDPTVHINWLGFLMFVLIGFGILGSAPISPYRMRNPRWGYLAAVAAGPLSNLLLAIIFGVIWRVLSPDPFTVNNFLFTALQMIILFNILLFLFNLLPLFPIDGWYIVLSLLPAELASWWQRNAQMTQYIFLGLLLLSFFPLLPFDPLSILIGQPLTAIYRLILGI